MAAHSPPRSAAPPAGGEAGAGTPARSGLARLLESGVMLSEQQQAKLHEAVSDGLESFEDYNTSRLQLAFSCFDKEMRLAVYELLFLLHVNDPRLRNFRFVEKHYETRNGARRQVPTEAHLDLYVEGAPAGVRGMDRLPDFFRGEYESYIEGVFGMSPYGEQTVDWPPIVTVQSVGSIGTIGHKTKDSDLDLQVVYDLNPFEYDTSEWDDGVFKDALNREHRWWINALGRQQKLSVEDVRKPEVRKRLSREAASRVQRAYPGLYRILVTEDLDFANGLFRSSDKTLRIQVLHEMLNLMRRAEKLRQLGEQRGPEALLKQRLQVVQEYINRKFPAAEIYLFVYSVEGFRQGTYASTLEFKESSGSAYEMILNYDTLMPGIQFTPMVPTHFLLPAAINNDTTLFTRLVDYVRYRSIDVMHELAPRLVDLGPTPDLKQLYVAQHGGAIYWEAFKASSGNLPKATLNLFRFEMLLDPRFVQTTIQMIKDPHRINRLASPKPPDEAPKPQRSTLSIIGREKPAASAPVTMETATEQLEAMAALRTGLPPWAVLGIEEEFPDLRLDPWWLRYKALKIAFADPNGVEGIPLEERHRLSKVIDLAFCLHLRISDVLQQARKPGDGRKQAPETPPTHREQVLLRLLERAFPAGSARRINLESLLTGGVRGLIHFENELRDLFQRSMTRVEDKMARLGVRDHVGDSKEVELWLNYYVENFQPMDHVVPRVIMKHLKVAREGIEISLREGGWVFMSIQRQKTILEAAKAAREVSYLPERVLLLENAPFLQGLAHCILNGYYGVLNKGTPEQHFTPIELDHRKINMGQNVHNDLAYVTQTQVRELAARISGFFGYQPYDYLDILRKERRITGVFVLVNLWLFGRVSVLYRDNLSTWYCEEIDVREAFENALTLSSDFDRFMRFKPIHETLAEVFKRRRIDLGQAALTCWVNPNSLAPDHTVSFPGKLKDMAHGTTLREAILRHHGIDMYRDHVPGAAPPGDAQAGQQTA